MPELPDLTPEMKAAIGKPGAPTTYEVTTLGIRTFARAVGYKNPLYFDAAASMVASLAPTAASSRTSGQA